jgi:hypothetical protein
MRDFSWFSGRLRCGDREAFLARTRQILNQKKNKKIIDSKNAGA